MYTFVQLSISLLQIFVWKLDIDPPEMLRLAASKLTLDFLCKATRKMFAGNVLCAHG